MITPCHPNDDTQSSAFRCEMVHSHSLTQIGENEKENLTNESGYHPNDDMQPSAIQMQNGAFQAPGLQGGTIPLMQCPIVTT